MNIYNLRLEVLTPVHVGTGEELGAIDYVIKNDVLYLIDVQRWFSDHAHEVDVNRALTTYNYLSLRSVLSKRDIKGYVKSQIKVQSLRLIELYKEAMDYRRKDNELRISLLPRNPVGYYPYLPGSSIKGVLRTAMGSAVAHTIKDAVEQDCPRRHKKNGCFYIYNQKIFGKTGFDVFKYLKVSDVVLPENSTSIVEPIEVSKNSDKKSTPKGYLEVVTPGVVAHAKLSIGEFLDKNGYMSKDKKITPKREIMEFDLKELISNLNHFYVPKFKHEIQKFYSWEHLSNVKNNLKDAEKRISTLKNNEALIRVGHFSHVECVTWDHVRKPQGRKIDGKNVYGKTRTLAGGSLPFGWVVLSFDENYQVRDNLPDFLEKKVVYRPKEKVVVKKELSEQDLLQERIKGLKRRLNALSFNRLPGELPGIMQEINSDKDEKFVAEAKKTVVEFVREKKLEKNFKKKKWYKKLIDSLK